MSLEIRRHSPTAHAAYTDLVSLLLDDMMAGIKGTPTARERGERIYWYDRYRIGDETQERYWVKTPCTAQQNRQIRTR